MKLLHFADLHLDTPFCWAPAELARARRRALRDTLTRICKLADELQVDALSCGGDLYEQERFTPDTAEFLRSTFEQISPLRVFLAPGNHDWLGPASLYRQVRWSPNVHVFTDAKLSAVELADGLTLWGAAHLAPANTDGFFNGFHVDRGGAHLALFHGSEQGDLMFQEEGKVPHAPFRAPQIPAAGIHHALLGHFHTPKDAEMHTYPGNPDPLAFGETGERAAVLVTVTANGSVTRERHPVATSTVRDVTVDLTGTTHSGDLRRFAKSVVSVAEAEEALEEANAELARVHRLQEALTLTRGYLEHAQDRVHRDIAPVLAATVKRWLPTITADRYTDVTVNPTTLQVQVCGPSRRWRQADLLSYGTAEQVYLLLRVALADHLTRNHDTCPLILDDITVHADSARTRDILNLLLKIAEERQVIIFTQEEQVAAWAREHLTGPDNLIHTLSPIPTT